MRRFAWGVLALLAACGNGPGAPSSGGAGGGVFRLERFCSVDELPASLRHTYVLIDEHALAKADTPAEFAERNAGVRDIVVAFTDPAAATLSGAMDYRERLSLMLLPADGSAARPLFEGCLPALSPEEISGAQTAGSALSDFFTGGVQQQLHNEGEQFRSRAISALVLAARNAPGPATPETLRLTDTKLVQSLRASGRMISGEHGLPRIVLLSNLARVDFGEDPTRETARRAGFQEGQESALDLGRAELHLFLAEGQNSSLARDYTQAFFLAQHANLLTWAGGALTTLPAAPVSIVRFSGEAAYPSGPESIQVRLAADRNGNLVSSWMVLRGSPNRSTPLTGPQTCEAPGQCRVSSDDGGFAQAWSLSPGGEPEFHNDMPFGGLREWELTTRDARLTGRVFDPAVEQIGPIPGNDAIALTARVSDEATF